MKEFKVDFKFHGFVTEYVETNSQEEAIQKAWKEVYIDHEDPHEIELLDVTPNYPNPNYEE